MTQKNRTTLTTDINTNIGDNTNGEISAADVRGALLDLADSCFNLSSDGDIVCSVSADSTVSVDNTDPSNPEIALNTANANTWTGQQTFNSSAPIIGTGTANRAVYLDGSKQIAMSSVTNTELGYLSGVTSAIQTQLDGKQNAGSSVSSVSGTTNRITSSGGSTPAIDISSSYVGQTSITTLGTIGTGTWQGTAIADGYLGTGINANKIGSGTVSNTEFGYLDGVTSSIQTQLDSKLSSGSYVTSISGTTNRITSSGGSTPAIDISSSYVGQSSITTLGTITTGTWNGTAVADGYLGTGINANKIGGGTVSSTEFGYLAGVTSAIQTQLNGKQASGSYITASSTDTLTNKNLTSGTNTFPTFNQNTTGSAAKWTTARNLAGNSVDGSANVTFANKFIVQGTSDSGLSAAQFLGALGTGIVKNTTSTGVLSIAAAGDFPTLNQNTTGSAATLTTARTIGGVSFNGSANITVASATGGFSVSGGDLAVGANNISCTGSLGSTGSRLTKGWFTDLQVTNAINGSITGNAATVTTNANLTGAVTSSGNATTAKVAYQFAVSDETTALTTGTAKLTFRMPHAMTLTEVRGSLNTAATGASLLTFNVKESGVTIFSTKPTFNASSKTTVGATTPAVISDTSLADDAEITVDIDQIGSTIAGAGLKITLIGTRT